MTEPKRKTKTKSKGRKGSKARKNSQHAASPNGQPKAKKKGKGKQGYQSVTLAMYAAAANEAHRGYEGTMRAALREAVPFAKVAGDNLRSAKDELQRERDEARAAKKEGREADEIPTWTQWLMDNFEGSHRTVNVYMQIAKPGNWEKIEPLLSDPNLSIRRVLRELNEDTVRMERDSDHWHAGGEDPEYIASPKIPPEWTEKAPKPGDSKYDEALKHLQKEAAWVFSRLEKWLVLYLGGKDFNNGRDMADSLWRLAEATRPVAKVIVAAEIRRREAMEALDAKPMSESLRSPRERMIFQDFKAEILDGLDLDSLTEDQRELVEAWTERPEKSGRAKPDFITAMRDVEGELLHTGLPVLPEDWEEED